MGALGEVLAMKQRKAILAQAREAQLKKFDVVFLITGRERRGKSVFLLHCLDDLGVPSLKGVLTLYGSEFHEIVHTAGFDQVVALDEAGEALFSRDSLKVENKRLVKTFQTCGYKRLITFLVMPNMKFIDRYFREHRIDGLFNVYARGKVNFFDRKRIETEIFRFKHVPVEVYKSDSFTDYQGKLREEYDRIKHEFVFARKVEPGTSLSLKDIIAWGLKIGKPQNEIAQFCGCSHVYVTQIKQALCK